VKSDEWHVRTVGIDGRRQNGGAAHEFSCSRDRGGNSALRPERQPAERGRDVLNWNSCKT
jgi:hypothetical protein